MFNIAPIHGSTKDNDICQAVNKIVMDYGGLQQWYCFVTDGA